MIRAQAKVHVSFSLNGWPCRSRSYLNRWLSKKGPQTWLLLQRPSLLTSTWLQPRNSLEIWALLFNWQRWWRRTPLFSFWSSPHFSSALQSRLWKLLRSSSATVPKVSAVAKENKPANEHTHEEKATSESATASWQSGAPLWCEKKSHLVPRYNLHPARSRGSASIWYLHLVLVIAQPSHGSDLAAAAMLLFPALKPWNPTWADMRALLKRFYAPAINLHGLHVIKSCKMLHVRPCGLHGLQLGLRN